jgi:two-component system, LytTR family, sensor kinase
MMKNSLSFDWRRIGLHVLFWSAYVPLNATLACIIQSQPVGANLLSAIQTEAFTLPIKIPFVYFFFYYIIPLYLERSKTLKLILLSLFAFVVTTLFYRLATILVILPYFSQGRKIVFFSPAALLLYAFDLFITLAAGLAVKLIRVHYQSLEFEQQLIREKLESELNFLRAQTNPHFLFNTLNNLYGLARKKSDQTPAAILMLSKIMRFMLYECRAPRIAVADEAKVISDYIDLEKLRYNHRLSVEYNQQINDPAASIAPLLLLPLVENSFKHGAGSTTGDAMIRVHLALQNNHLSFLVENTFDPDGVVAQPAPGTGIGLKNIRRQLDLIYPDRYSLKTGAENGLFRAELALDLS